MSEDTTENQAPVEDGKRMTYHEEDEKMIVRYEQDVETVLKLNHEQRAAECSVERIGEWHQTMRVPEVVMLDIKFKHGWDYQNPDHWPMVKQLLKGPEYAAFRTTNRRI
jgi:hypothetical protein